MENGPSNSKKAFSILATLLFGFGTGIIAVRLFDHRPMLRVDARGIWFRPLSDSVIPWTAVSRAWVPSVRGQYFISLQLRQPEHFVWKGRFRFLQPLNGVGFSDLILSAQGLDCSFDEQKAAIERRVHLTSAP